MAVYYRKSGSIGKNIRTKRFPKGGPRVMYFLSAVYGYITFCIGDIVRKVMLILTTYIVDGAEKNAQSEDQIELIQIYVGMFLVFGFVPTFFALKWKSGTCLTIMPMNILVLISILQPMDTDRQ